MGATVSVSPEQATSKIAPSNTETGVRRFTSLIMAIHPYLENSEDYMPKIRIRGLGDLPRSDSSTKLARKCARWGRAENL